MRQTPLPCPDPRVPCGRWGHPPPPRYCGFPSNDNPPHTLPSSPPGLWLHEYLDGLFTLGSPASLPFHHLQPSLYASHAPGRLLAFLRASQAYRPDQALAEARRVADVDSQALLLCRMGRHPQARGEGGGGSLLVPAQGR